MAGKCWRQTTNDFQICVFDHFVKWPLIMWKWKSLSRVRLFVTPWLLCPWGFSRPEYWSGLPCPPPGDLPNPGIDPRSPAFQANSFLSESPGKPKLVVKVKSLSRVRLFATSWTIATRLLCPWDFPGNSTGVDCHFLLQGIFPTQGSNPGLSRCNTLHI